MLHRLAGHGGAWVMSVYQVNCLDNIWHTLNCRVLANYFGELIIGRGCSQEWQTCFPF